MTTRDVLRVLGWVFGVALGWLLLVWLLVTMTTAVLAAGGFAWDPVPEAEVYHLYVSLVPLVDWIDPETGEAVRTPLGPRFYVDDRASFAASVCTATCCCIDDFEEPPDELVYYFVTADVTGGGRESDGAMRARLVEGLP